MSPARTRAFPYTQTVTGTKAPPALADGDRLDERLLVGTSLGRPSSPATADAWAGADLKVAGAALLPARRDLAYAANINAWRSGGSWSGRAGP